MRFREVIKQLALQGITVECDYSDLGRFQVVCGGQLVDTFTAYDTDLHGSVVKQLDSYLLDTNTVYLTFEFDFSNDSLVYPTSVRLFSYISNLV